MCFITFVYLNNDEWDLNENYKEHEEIYEHDREEEREIILQNIYLISELVVIFFSIKKLK